MTVKEILNLVEQDTTIRIIDDEGGNTLAIADNKSGLKKDWDNLTVLGISAGLEFGDCTFDIYVWSADKETEDDTNNKLNSIRTFVNCCEEVQESNESRYTKQCAIETAYEHIKKVVLK